MVWGSGGRSPLDNPSGGLDELERAGLVEQCVNKEGDDAMRLTTQGVRAVRQMAISSEDKQDTRTAALVDATGVQTSRCRMASPTIRVNLESTDGGS